MAYDPTDWDTADKTAKDTAQHFYTDSSGAHVTDESGANVLIDSTGMYVSDGTDNLAQFTNPTIIGKTGNGEPNFKIGNVSPFGDGIFVCNGSTVKLMLWEEVGTNGGYIQSGDGGYLGIYDGSLYFTPFGKSRFTILDTNNQSSFAIGGVHVYGGSIVKTVTATREPVVFSNAEVRSMFNVASGDEDEIGLTITNGDYGAQAHRITSISYRSSSGWSVYLDGNASAGAFRFNYVAVVPDSKSTV